MRFCFSFSVFMHVFCQILLLILFYSVCRRKNKFQYSSYLFTLHRFGFVSMLVAFGICIQYMWPIRNLFQVFMYRFHPYNTHLLFLLVSFKLFQPLNTTWNINSKFSPFQTSVVFTFHNLIISSEKYIKTLHLSQNIGCSVFT